MPMPKFRLSHNGDSLRTFEPNKHFVNLRRLKWRLTIDISIIVASAVVITYKVIRSVLNSNSKDNSYIVTLIIIWIFTAILITGSLKFNGFHKGYDVDISDEHIEKTENPADKP
jgi:hypothetical protein